MSVKKFFVLGVFVLSISSVKASYVLIEDDQDLVRVGNNFAYFYKENASHIREIQNSLENREECVKYVEKMFKNMTGLTKDIFGSYERDSINFVREFKQTNHFIREHGPLIRSSFSGKGDMLRDFSLGYNAMGKILEVIGTQDS